MVLLISPKKGLGNICHKNQEDKEIQPISMSANISLSNKYTFIRSTKNLFKNTAHQQAT